MSGLVGIAGPSLDPAGTQAELTRMRELITLAGESRSGGDALFDGVMTAAVIHPSVRQAPDEPRFARASAAGRKGRSIPTSALQTRGRPLCAAVLGGRPCGPDRGRRHADDHGRGSPRHRRCLRGGALRSRRTARAPGDRPFRLRIVTLDATNWLAPRLDALWLSGAPSSLQHMHGVEAQPVCRRLFSEYLSGFGGDNLARGDYLQSKGVFDRFDADYIADYLHCDRDVLEDLNQYARFRSLRPLLVRHAGASPLGRAPLPRAHLPLRTRPVHGQRRRRPRLHAARQHAIQGAPLRNDALLVVPRVLLSPRMGERRVSGDVAARRPPRVPHTADGRAPTVGQGLNGGHPRFPRALLRRLSAVAPRRTGAQSGGAPAHHGRPPLAGGGARSG